MGAMASQITSLTIVYSTVNSGADQRKHKSPASLAFVLGIHRWPVNSRTNGPLSGKCFHLITSSWFTSRAVNDSTADRAASKQRVGNKSKGLPTSGGLPYRKDDFEIFHKKFGTLINLTFLMVDNPAPYAKKSHQLFAAENITLSAMASDPKETTYVSPSRELGRHISYTFCLQLLTHWGLDKMDAISQTTLSNAFLWMKMFEFWLKFHLSLFLRVQLTIFQHWFR